MKNLVVKNINVVYFKINLINVPVLNINKYLSETDFINRYENEDEYIFLGGGKFYKNSNMIEEGFTYNKKDNVYETWYTIKDTNQDTRTKK